MLEGLHSASFMVKMETLPADYGRLPMAQLQSVLIEGYIRPYYSGWHRPVYPSTPLRIAGLEFTPQPHSPGLGFIGLRTSISVLFPSNLPQYPTHQVVFDLGFFQHTLMINQSIPGAPISAMGTPPGIIQELPIRVMDRRRSEDLQYCMVCMNELAVGDQLKSLPCCMFHVVHEFHLNCIDQWLARSALCPLCKANVTETYNRTRQLG